MVEILKDSKNGLGINESIQIPTSAQRSLWSVVRIETGTGTCPSWMRLATSFTTLKIMRSNSFIGMISRCSSTTSIAYNQL